MKTTMMILGAIATVLGLGCAALSSYITPADIDSGAVGYAISAGIAEPNDYAGYHNLLKAERLKYDVDTAHQFIQFDYVQRIEKDKLVYTQHKGVVSSNLAMAQQREEMLFGETGLLSLGLSMAGFGTLTGIIGLMRKRPGDITPEEVKTVVAEAVAIPEDELTEKQLQFIQLVAGVQKFIDTYKNPEAVVELKNIMDKTQDTSTQVAVAEAKASVLT